MNIALIIAGGVGSRTGQSIPKQFLTVNEKPILIYTLEKFQECELIDKIYITVREEYFAITEDYIKQYKISKVNELIIAGESRNKSIANAMTEIQKIHNPEDTIVIHHANMPFVSSDNIENAILAVNDNNIVFSAVPQFDYMYKDIESNISIIDRNNVFSVRVPEAMSIYNAYDIYANILKEKESMPPLAILDISDEYQKKFNFVTVECSTMNFKITTYDDFRMARAIILLDGSQ